MVFHGIKSRNPLLGIVLESQNGIRVRKMGKGGGGVGDSLPGGRGKGD